MLKKTKVSGPETNELSTIFKGLNLIDLTNQEFLDALLSNEPSAAGMNPQIIARKIRNALQSTLAGEIGLTMENCTVGRWIDTNLHRKVLGRGVENVEPTDNETQSMLVRLLELLDLYQNDHQNDLSDN